MCSDLETAAVVYLQRLELRMIMCACVCHQLSCAGQLQAPTPKGRQLAAQPSWCVAQSVSHAASKRHAQRRSGMTVVARNTTVVAVWSIHQWPLPHVTASSVRPLVAGPRMEVELV